MRGRYVGHKNPFQYYNNLDGMLAYIRGLVGDSNIPIVIGAPATNLQNYNQLVVDDMNQIAKDMNDVHIVEIGESEGGWKMEWMSISMLRHHQE